MPKRTNTFQRLVKLLHERLVDETWEVNESEMLVHSLNGEEREVDIVLRYKPKIGNYEPVLISIECCDRKKPADSTWIEQLVKKHEFLPTSNLVLWSSNGFYKPALSLAEKYLVKTISPRSDIEQEWAVLSRIIKDSFLKVVSAEFSHFIDAIDLEGKEIRLDALNNYLFRINSTEEFFTINQIKDCVINTQGLRTTMLDHATQEKTDFWVQFIPPFECQVQNENGDWINPFRIGFGIKTDVEETLVVEAKTVHYENTLSTLAVGKLKNGSFEMFIQEEPGGCPVITSHLIKNKVLT